MQKLLVLAFLAIGFHSKAQQYSLENYGIKQDSNLLQTQTIQHVIDKAEEAGGGTIIVPKGVYLTGALFFKPKTHLLLQEGAVLKGSENINDYPLQPSRMEGKNLMYYAALINAYYVDSFSIAGPGTINGNGLKYWQAFWQRREDGKQQNRIVTNLEVHRPRLVFIWGCNNVNIKNVKLHNSGFWTTHLYQCSNVLMDSCDIRSPYKPVPAPSTDGVDIDACKKVTIRNSYISVNDDAVCIKGGKGPFAHLQQQNGIVEDVLVENCDFGDSHGTLTLGSECIHAKNITMRNCKVDNNTPILRLKMRPDTYQVYENIVIDGVTGKCGTIINMAPWKQFFNLEGSIEKPFAKVSNISFSNINVQCKQFGIMEGNPLDQVSNISFKNIEAKAEIPSLKTKYTGIAVDKVMVNGAALVVQP